MQLFAKDKPQNTKNSAVRVMFGAGKEISNAVCAVCTALSFVSIRCVPLCHEVGLQVPCYRVIQAAFHFAVSSPRIVLPKSCRIFVTLLCT